MTYLLGLDLFTWITLPILALFVQLVKTAIGMGWGVIMSPVLLALNYDREIVVVSLLFCELITSFGSSIAHYVFNNVQLTRKQEQLNNTRRKPKAKGSEITSLIESNSLINENNANCASHKSDPNNNDDVNDSNNIVINNLDDNKKALSLQGKDTSITVRNKDDITNSEEDDDDSDSDTILPKEGTDCCINSFRKLSVDTQIIIILSSLGAIGGIASVTVSSTSKQSNTAKFCIKLYVGISLITIGTFMFIAKVYKRKQLKRKGQKPGEKSSDNEGSQDDTIVNTIKIWKVLLIGVWTGFNKGISGSGGGPITVNGLVLSGRPERNAIGVAPFCEIIVCGICTISYFASNYVLEGFSGLGKYYSLVPPLLTGALPAIPIAAFITKHMKRKPLQIIIPFFAIFLGLFSIIQTSLDWYGYWPHWDR